MGKKILIIGGVAGGASAAARIRRLDESAKIIIFEKGPHVSFSNCSLPYRLSDTVNKTEDLILMSPEKFLKQYNIEARVNSEVVKIQRNEKKILVRDHASGREYEESYDKLILSPGARPILPRSIEGIDKEHVFTARSVVDIDRLYTYLKKNNIEDVAVVGGGYIGLEIADNLHLAGKKVSIIEASEQVMAPFDNDMAQILHKEIYDKGVNLILNDAVVKIDSDHLVLESGRKVNAKAVVVAVGVAPDTALAKDAGLEIGATGAIKVDHNYLTSDKDIYAIGDAIEVYSRLEHRYFTCGLAGPAQRQARAAADHIYGIPYRNNGHICTSIVKLFDLNAASTGLNEKRAKATGIPYDFVYIIPHDKVSLMPDSNIMHFKLIYEYPTGRILGAQAIGKGNVDKRIDVIATLILMGGTLEDAKELELCYAPPFSTPKDVINHAALVGLNLLDGRYEQVPVTKVRELVENNAFIVDVREKDEYDKGHLINAINIPLSELRSRANEIPKDRPVYLHCRTGQRSYYAVMALQGMGYRNVYNVSGSFLGICYYEYYQDQITGRKKIVTEYIFE